MSECCITFPGPVSKSTLTRLVIDYLKYILYYRGQFPLPLDQLKRVIKVEESSALPDSSKINVNNHPVYYDPSEQENQLSAISRKPSLINDRTKRNFKETVIKFDDFFNQLSNVLEHQDVLEVVLNLGANMMNPKELYRITLPSSCICEQCAQDYAPWQRCRLLFFQAIMQSTLWNDLNSDSPLPISILLLLGPGVTLTEHMEQKRFYSLPRNSKPRTVRFTNICDHVNDKLDQLQNFCNLSISQSVVPTSASDSGLWVQMKTQLRGFKCINLL